MTIFKNEGRAKEMEQADTVKPEDKPVLDNYDFYQKLRDGAYETHELIVKGQPIYMRLLTAREKREIEKISKMKFLEISENARVPALLSYFDTLNTLRKALNLPKQGQPVSNEELENLLDADLLELYRLYVELEQKFSPKMEEMTQARFDYLVDELEKKKISLNSLSRSELEVFTSRILQEMSGLMDRFHTLSSVEATT